MQANRPKGPSKRRTEKFFVQVAGADNTLNFFNVTEKIGQKMPFEQPKATCAMRATEDGIFFSYLTITKKNAGKQAERLVEVPRGPLAKLERKSHNLGELTDNQLFAEVRIGEDAEGNAITHSLALTLTKDANGVGTVDVAEGQEDATFELPRAAVQVYVYLKSPAARRNIGVMYLGYPGKPGDPTTGTRAVSHVLYSLTQLLDFRILSGLETVTMPSAPARWNVQTMVRRPEDKPGFALPVQLFTDAAQLVAAGTVDIEVDLDNANPGTGRLLFHYKPDAALEPHFETYRRILDSTVAGLVTTDLGVEDVANITYEIVLGAVEPTTVQRLNEALASIRGLDLTPAQMRQHVAA